MSMFFLPGLLTMVTYAEHLTWSGTRYVLSLNLKSSESATFSVILLFTVCFKSYVDSVLVAYFLYVQLVKP